jgi:putative phosphoesterase
MTVAVLADVHSNLHALQAVLAEVDRLNVTSVFCAGDVVGYGAFPNECCSIIKDRRCEFVLGNHDIAALHGDHAGMNPFAARAILWTADKLNEDSKAFLREAKKESRFLIDDRKAAMYHGSPTSIDEYVFEDKVTEELMASSGADILILGHTHVPCVIQKGARLFINPGSVGQPRDGNMRASFALFDSVTNKCTVMRVPYDLDAAAESIRTAGLPRFLADRLYRGM